MQPIVLVAQSLLLGIKIYLATTFVHLYILSSKKFYFLEWNLLPLSNMMTFTSSSYVPTCSRMVIKVAQMYLLDSSGKIQNFLCGHSKGHSPFLYPIGSVYTLLFVVMSAHTLLGSVCCTTWHYLHKLVVHTLYLVQLYCCTFIL